jgi:TubC N-terminal docking domain
LTAKGLLHDLLDRGVSLTATADRLRIDAPAGTLTPDLVAAIRDRKAELLSLIREQNPPAAEARVCFPGAGQLGTTEKSGLTADSSCVLCGRGSYVEVGDAAVCSACVSAPTTPLCLGYRSSLRRCWALMVEGDLADQGEASAVLDELNRLLDEVGEPSATGLRRRWAEEWHRDTGRCPTCGEPGSLHGDAAAGDGGQHVMAQASRLCSRCHAEQARPGQRWGPACFAAAKREYRRRAKQRAQGDSSGDRDWHPRPFPAVPESLLAAIRDEFRACGDRALTAREISVRIGAPLELVLAAVSELLRSGWLERETGE